MKNLYKQNKEKLKLKRMSHDVVDRIRRKGYNKTEIYLSLAAIMGVEEPQSHFGNMNTLRELEKAYQAVLALEGKLPSRSAVIMRAKMASKLNKAQQAIKQPKKKKEPRPNFGPSTIPREQYQETLREVERINAEKLKWKTDRKFIVTQYKNEPPVVSEYSAFSTEYPADVLHWSVLGFRFRFTWLRKLIKMLWPSAVFAW